MRWAAEHWDGLRLVRPNVSYELWDADKVTGCLCDDGYSGYNCSRRDCPRGDTPETGGQQHETVTIECQADAGSFALSFGGATSEAIPYDARYGRLAWALQNMRSMGQVDIGMENYSAPICGWRVPTRTTVTFRERFGPLPAARVVVRDLSLRGGPSVLSMVTVQTLLCPAGACGPTNCTGGVYLDYDGALTPKLGWNASRGAVQGALLELPTLGAASDFGDVNLTVKGSPTLCGDDQHNLTFEFRADYGNVYSLSLVNSLRSSYGHTVNLTLVANKGTTENEFCSDRGSCDFATGTCRCLQLARPPWEYEYASSNGYGGEGTRGDCGRIARTPRSCPVAYNDVFETNLECGGHGECENTTMTCKCQEGYYGGDCRLRRCPEGPAWFGEPTGPDEAHAPVECSNMGVCDHIGGRCLCRDGFSGLACERMDCPIDESGQFCSGRGTCLPMWRLAEETDYSGEPAGITYGAHTQQHQGQWDSRRIYGCKCDTKDISQPDAGPVGFVSGIRVDNPGVGGYTGYDCSLRWCPAGDDPRTDGDFEVQTIRCTASPASDVFRVTFRQRVSTWIDANASAADVKIALENMSTIGDVTVSITDGHAACDPTWSDPSGLRVTFISNLGDVPLMTTQPAFNVSETVKGTKEEDACANRGYCDYSTGLCMCLEGYGSSDGDGKLGSRRDCGTLEPCVSVVREF